MKIYPKSNLIRIGASAICLLLMAITGLATSNPSANEPTLAFPAGFTTYDPLLTSQKMASDIKNSTDDRTVSQWNWLKEMYWHIYVANWNAKDFLYVDFNSQIQANTRGDIYRQYAWVQNGGGLVGGVVDGIYGNKPFGTGGWSQQFLGRFSYNVGSFSYASNFSLKFWSRIPAPQGITARKYKFTWRIIRMFPDPANNVAPREDFVLIETQQSFGVNTLNQVTLPSAAQIGSSHWKLEGVNVQDITTLNEWTTIDIDPSIFPFAN